MLTTSLKKQIFGIYLSTWYCILNPGGKKIKLAGNRTIYKEIACQAKQVRYLIGITESEFSLN